MVTYRKATTKDLEELTSLRLDFVEVTKEDQNFDQIRESTYRYFKEHLENDSCHVVLAEEEGTIVGTGIVFFYRSVPSKTNPEGKNAYITSMFVAETHRKQGIGRKLLDYVILSVREKGYPLVMLSATKMGRILYEKYGFMDVKDAMVYHLKDQ